MIRVGVAFAACMAFAHVATAAPQPLRDIVQLSVGGGHVCAVTSKHGVACWGDNSAGQLGVDATGHSVAGGLAHPHPVGGLPPIASVAAGLAHTCALDLDGAVHCWGSAGADLRVTDGGASASIELRGARLGTPVVVPLGTGKAHLVALSTIQPFACAAFADDVRCWKTMGSIPLDAKTIQPPTVVTAKVANATALAIGHGKACAITGGDLACWHLDGGAVSRAVWTRGDAIVPARVSIGEMYACVVSTKGEARCWWSLIDDFWKKPPNRPIRWTGKRATRAIATGDSPICSVDTTGVVDCFLSDEGGLTDDAADASWASTALEAHPIAGIDHAIEIGISRGRDVFGYGFGCALRSTGDVACWGDNEHGQLGTDDTTRSLTARPVTAARER